MNKHHKYKRGRGKRPRLTSKDGVYVDELADELGLGKNQTYEALRSGVIPALRIGRRWWIARATMERIKAGELVNNYAVPAQ
jgi:excisionase family DNA binding protein